MEEAASSDTFVCNRGGRKSSGVGMFVEHVYFIIIALIGVAIIRSLFIVTLHLTSLLDKISEDKPGNPEKWSAKQIENPPSAPLAEGTPSIIELRRQLSSDQKMKSLGQVAAGIAHELNTPIQYVSNNIAFIRDELLNVCGLLSEYKELTQGIPECKSGIERINKLYRESDPEYLINEIPTTLSQTVDGLNHITHIVAAMREYSHPGGTTPVSVDINRVIRTVTTLARNEWKYVADLSLDLDPSLPCIECHQGDISQVLLNLVVNSAQAIEEKTGGRSKGSIKISTRWMGDAISISIEDSGGGIPKELLTRIFDPFFTTKPVGKGTGQGLAISLHLIKEIHQGDLSVTSNPGIGSTFTITLPRAWGTALNSDGAHVD